MRNMELFSMGVDDRFEDMDIIDTSPAPVRLKTIPHCDCHASNEAFLGRKIKLKSDRFSPYDMVPVKVDKHDSCIHCGYQAVSMVPFVHE